MEILVYAANGLYVAAYFTSNMLRLRVLTVTAATCLAAYFYCRPEPLMTVVGWNLFFIALNMFQITRIVLARHGDATAGPAAHGKMDEFAPRPV